MAVTGGGLEGNARLHAALRQLLHGRHPGSLSAVAGRGSSGNRPAASHEQPHARNLVHARTDDEFLAPGDVQLPGQFLQRGLARSSGANNRLLAAILYAVAEPAIRPLVAICRLPSKPPRGHIEATLNPRYCFPTLLWSRDWLHILR